MYSELDHRFMSRALDLARNALFQASPNPRVGCVVVRDGHILGEGWTQPPGSNHAEIEALLDARRNGHDLHGATAYVTLEPCSHFGEKLCAQPFLRETSCELLGDLLHSGKLRLRVLLAML